MTKKNLFAVLMLAMMVSVLVPMVSVSGAGIPNPDHIYYAVFGGPETTDGGWAYDTASGELIQNIYEPLCAYDGVGTDSYVPMLAESWPGSDNVATGRAILPSPPDPNAPAGTHETWYFKIRTGVKWQDPKYGTVKPSDVEYTFERGMLMDHTGGPQWLIYSPLLGVMGSSSFDANGNEELEESEYLALENAVKSSVQSNSTHVWFNLPAPFAPFQQIIIMSWGQVYCKQWMIDHGCWNGEYGNYAEFQRTYDPPSPGPLMVHPDAPGPVIPGPVAMGTGPYKLKAINPDPHTGWWTLERFADYWQGWPAPGAAGYAQFVTEKNVEEWSNRKAQFFSTDPELQADFNTVPRANTREMHPGGNKDVDPYPGFRLAKVPAQVIGALYYVYTIAQPSDYTPKIGADPKPDLFTDRDMRLAISYCFNATRYLEEYWLGEAETPTTCMPPGTAFYNTSKPTLNINLAKAEELFKKAWNGDVWSKGFTLKITYNIGNTARETVAKILEDVIEHRINWPAGVPVDIQPTGVPWSNYLVDMYTQKLSAFIIGWMADYPDPHNWFMPFMHSEGDYSGVAQAVVYGLGDIAAYWPAGPSYGPPPYTNALGEKVTAINNTYVDHLIETAIGATADLREKIYNELMDIYYAEHSQLPVYFSFTRHYERTWCHGWLGTYNENPIAPGYYFYTIWKAPAGVVFTVDVSATDTITNATTAYPLIQVHNGEMRLNGKPASINYTVHVVYKTGTPDIWAYVGLVREGAEGASFFPVGTTISLSPGEEYTDTFMWYENGISTAVSGGRGIMEPGQWTISLYVSPTGAPGGDVEDTDLTNNKAAHTVKVTAKVFREDLDGSGTVNILDITVQAKAFGSKEGEPRWSAAADIDGNGIINILDLSKTAKMFGKTLFDLP